MRFPGLIRSLLLASGMLALSSCGRDLDDAEKAVPQPSWLKMDQGKTRIVLGVATRDLAGIGTLPARSLPGGACLVPDSAVLRQAGRTWLYVEVTPGSFVRQAIRLVRMEQENWVVEGKVRPGDLVVTRGAGTLLSEELKALIPVEEED